jgi:hypothetical protein
LPTKLRPREVSEWIRSKKKDVVPVVKPPDYGSRFRAWWTLLQPPWRKNKNMVLVHHRDIPNGETWQPLRRGGTAGIYIVVMGLSWWIKIQEAEHDANAWSTVEDLLWVIQQMNQYMASDVPVPAVPKKRTHDEHDEDGGDKGEGQQKKRSVL